MGLSHGDRLSARIGARVDHTLGVPVRTVIGESLRQAGIVSETDLREALAEHGRSGERLGSVLIRLHLASERQIAEVLAHQLGLPFADLTEHPPMVDALLRIPKKLALTHTCVALAVEKNVLTVAMADPLLFSLVQDLEFHTGCRVRRVVATREDITEAIRHGYPEAALALVPQPDPSTRPEPATSDSAPMIDLVDLVIKSALRSGASDVHIEPTESGVTVRHRLDGLLKEVMDLPKWVHEGLVARIKVMAGLDIAEKRLPQDGRIRTSTDGGHSLDLRVSTLRTIQGEKVVLRVLDHRKGVPPLETLGFSPAALAQLQTFLRHQHGMILVVGPTGSGKTTTLCSALASLRSERTNIVTIEDPVEYQIPGVNQTQINSKIELTFARSLRAILRQDPDVVLVGEIRDHDTARVAMQAAQTGHLVLSTLHTDDAPSSVTRLADIGIEPYVSASALVGVIAQRLVRRLCMSCRRMYTPEPERLRALGIPEADLEGVTFYDAVGCEQCRQTGYRGRIGIYEIMSVTDEIRRLIARKVTGGELCAAARAAGMRALGEDGLLKVKAGLTTPEELLRVVTDVRKSDSACSKCGSEVEPDFIVCPACSHHLGGGCSYCGRALQPDWKYCPYCAESTGATAERQVSRALAPRLRAVR
jgi:type IV pilus assembly protein PilB